jgi:hypothetical protein
MDFIRRGEDNVFMAVSYPLPIRQLVQWLKYVSPVTDSLSSLFAVEFLDDIDSAAECSQAFFEGLAGRIDPQRGNAGVAPGPYALAYHRLCA